MSGHTFHERVKTTDYIIETKDGYHPLPPHSIFRDRERRDEAIVIINQGVITPENAEQSAGYINKVCMNIEGVKMSYRNPNINKMWKRQAAALFIAMIKYGFPFVVLLGFAYLFLGGIFGS